MFKHFLSSSRTISFLFLILFNFKVFPQDTVDEIIVTADFSERHVKYIPSSISLLDSEYIENSSNQHFEELILSVPNLNWSGDGNRARYFQIRGVGELEQYEGAPNPSIGFLVDDIDFSGIGSVATLFDIDQIEILRGSQSSRYGANALGGLIYMKSVDPSSEKPSKIQVRIAGDDEIAAGVALGGELTNSENIKYRMSIHHHKSNGFRANRALNREDTNQRKETSIRYKLNWKLSENLFITSSNMFVDLDNGYDAFSIDNSLNMLSDNPGKDAQKSVGSSLKAIYSGNDLYELQAITSIANSKITFSYDADWGNQASWLPFTYDYFSQTKRNRKTMSQEIRFLSTNKSNFSGSPEWIIGSYFLKLNEDINVINTGDYNDPIYVYSDTLNTEFDSNYESLSSSIYGNFNSGIGRNTEISLGLRLENRDTDYSDSDSLSMSPSETMFGGELAFSKGFSENINGYINFNQSYKAGGFNLGIAPEEKRSFDKELMLGVETGLKSIFKDGSLQLNAAIFYNRRKNQQVRVSKQLIPNDPASFVFYTDNAANGKSMGFESNLRWIQNETIQFYVNLGILKAQFNQYRDQPTLINRDVAHAPRYTISTGIDYRQPNGFFAMLSISAKDEFYFDVSHNQKSQKFEIINMHFGLEKDNWSVKLFLNNLLNEDYSVRGFFFGNEPPDFPSKLYTRKGDPRQIGLKYEMRFN